MKVNGEALQLHVVKKPYQYYKSLENSYQVFVHLNVQKSKVEIIITISTKLYRKKWHSFLAIGIVTHAAHS